MAKQLNPKTAEIVAAIRTYAAGKILAPVVLTACYSRSHVSPAIQEAKRLGLIEVAYKSCAGTPAYRRTEVI